MEYGNLFGRAANLVWNRKFLIVLGMLAALGGGGGLSAGSNSARGGGEFDFPRGMQMPDLSNVEIGAIGGAGLLLLCTILFVVLAVWVVATLGRGGMIRAVDDLEESRETGLGISLRAAWQRIWTLLGIALLPGIPAFVLVALTLFAGLTLFNMVEITDAAVPVRTTLGAVVALLTCVLLGLSLFLGLLRTFADRACLLEGRGILDAYARGWSVLSQNLGAAIILFLLQIVITIGLAILLFLPGIVLALCCLLWPLLLVVQGAITAFFSSVWTLAWREWTGMAPLKTQ